MMNSNWKSLSLLLFFSCTAAHAQTGTSSEGKPSKAWYEKISLKGYTQIRYNRLLETNPDLNCEQCDRSLGDSESFFIRRARLTFSGDVHERLYFYFQPDFATNGPGDNKHFAQIRDAYADLALDSKKEFRLRFGQSKVPYGFENLQSSGYRAPFDRSDALNSGAPNERDLGVMFFWAPSQVRKTFKELANPSLKGSGDYGVFALGTYNGQSANRPEANNNRHLVARLAYPVAAGDAQIIEPTISAYSGEFTPFQRTAGVGGATSFRDRRISAGVVLYPQPFGFQAEATQGRGPEYDPGTNSILLKDLHGGYAQILFQMNLGDHLLIPYARTQYYRGGKKQETDARRHFVREHEIGTEWHPIPAFELTAAYTLSERRTSDSMNPSRDEEGRRLRLQVQFNY